METLYTECVNEMDGGRPLSDKSVVDDNDVASTAVLVVVVIVVVVAVVGIRRVRWDGAAELSVSVTNTTKMAAA